MHLIEDYIGLAAVTANDRESLLKVLVVEFWVPVGSGGGYGETYLGSNCIQTVTNGAAASAEETWLPLASV